MPMTVAIRNNKLYIEIDLRNTGTPYQFALNLHDFPQTQAGKPGILVSPSGIPGSTHGLLYLDVRNAEAYTLYNTP